ncbi:hypothetical protein Ctob_004839 [Chrysochromulina tobinii]|uniref:Uncharacterized protein n=1 Tax=Chrysochromulina tobinii TaxID=1460289 RepID=A0A0M0JST4_9EUKA|nr:hypothetical protein Ctob_004839 [Chrysochromulina tobinii]|eukprot:KOO29248.1 hypothetical protein Ctob_004839 [Chrysochromulina sp. CCMP291]
MLEWSGGTMTALDQRGAQYHWALCGQILPVQHLQGPIGPCNASLSVNDVAAATRVAGPYDLGPDGPPGACETVGLWKDTLGYPAVCYLLEASQPGNGIKCDFKPSTVSRGFVVEYQCADNSVPPAVRDIGKLYVASMADPNACELPAPYPWVLVLSCAGSGVGLLCVLVLGCLWYRSCSKRNGGGDSRPPARRDGDRAVPGSTGNPGKKPAKWITGADGSCVKSEEDLKEELLAQSRAEYGASSGACSSRAAAGGASASTSAAPSAASSGNKYGAYAPPKDDDDDGPAAYTPTTADGRPEEAPTEDVAKGLAAAARINGLEALMTASGLLERLPAAGNWCEEQKWQSVAHLRSGGSRAAEAFVAAMRLKPDGPRARRLKKELKKDEFGWDAHAAAAREAF